MEVVRASTPPESLSGIWYNPAYKDWRVFNGSSFLSEQTELMATGEENSIWWPFICGVCIIEQHSFIYQTQP